MSKVVVEMERACLQECDELRTELSEAEAEIERLRAALARMEALVEYVDHTEECAYQFGCTCGLSELLAACERKEAGR